MSSVVSVNVGLPRDVPWKGRTVRTAVWKTPVAGRVLARRLNLEGDGQADLQGHGGEQRAVMVYQLNSYRHWAQHLHCSENAYGQFGENLTVDGLADDEVCIGDRYRIGAAVFEVSQPRVTCYRVGIRMNNPELPALLVAHGRPGFYMRVIQEGEIGAGDEIVKIADGPERMSVADVDALLYRSAHPAEQLRRALRIDALSPGWRSSFEALLKACADGKAQGNAGLTGAPAETPAWPGFRPLRIVSTRQESEDVRSYVLAAADGSRLPAAQAGQHVVIRPAPPPGAPALTRIYSLSGNPGAATYRISIKREGEGSASERFHRLARVGDMVDVSAPRGSFCLQPDRRPVVLMSAGVGVTPVLAMLYSLAATDSASPRPVWWLHGARDGLHHSFRDEAAQLVAALAQGRKHVAYSQPGATDRLGQDFDSQGHLDTPLLDRLGVPADADFYLCGPARFLSDLDLALRQWGIAPSCLHAEVFGAGTPQTPGLQEDRGPVHPPAGEPGTGALVTFVRSGLAVRWGTRFQSLLELAEACEVPASWSCRTGVCHMCESALIDGNVSYSPEPLDAPAEGRVLICCARPDSDIQLDL